MEGRCKRMGKGTKCPTRLKPAALLRGGDGPCSMEPLASPSCSRARRAGVGTAGFQGAASGAEIYAVFDKKKVRFSSSCLQLAGCREAAAVRLRVFQSHTLRFGSGDQVPRDTGNSPCSRTEHLVQIFSFYKNDSDFFKAVACPFVKQSLRTNSSCAAYFFL